MAGRRIPPILIRSARALAALLVLTALLTGLFLGSEQGRQRILAVISSVFATQNFRIELHGLTFASGVNLRNVSIADANGVWFEARDARLALDIAPLARGRVVIREARVADINITRLPSASESSSQNVLTLPRIWVERIDVPRINLGRDVLGQEARLRLHGEMRLGPEKSSASGALDREDRPDSLHFSTTLTTTTASLDLSLHESPGGLLHTLVGLRDGPGITMQITGNGPRTACPIAIKTQFANLASLTGQATVTLTEARAVALTAQIDLGSDIRRYVSGLSDTPIHLTGLAIWRNDVLCLSDLELESNIARMNVNGTWSDEELELTARASALGITGRMPEGVQPGPCAVNATLHMGAQSMAMAAHGRIDNWIIHGQPISSEMNATWSKPADQDTWEGHAAMSADLPGLDPSHGHITAVATLSGNATATKLNTARIIAPRLRAGITGSMDDHIHLVSVVDLLGLSVLGLPPLRGHLETSLEGVVDTTAERVEGRFTGNATGLEGGPAWLDPILGQRVGLAAEFSASTREVLIHSARLAARAVATGHGKFLPESRTFTAGISATTPDLSYKGVTLKGLGLEGHLAGTLDDFSASMSSRTREITFGTLRLGHVTLETEINDLPFAPRIKLSAREETAPLALRTQAAWQDGQLAIDQGVLTVPDTTGRISGFLDTEAMTFSGEASVTSQNLRALGKLAGEDLNGALAAQMQFFPERSGQGLRFHGQATRLAGAGIGMDEVNVTGKHVPGRLDNGTSVEARIHGLTLGATRLDRCEASLRGQPSGIAGTLTLDDSTTKTSLLAAAQLSVSKTSHHLQIDHLRGKALGQTLRLLHPLHVEAGTNDLNWNEATLIFGSATIHAQGHLAPSSEALIQMRNLELGALTPYIPAMPRGRLDARLEVSGPRQGPDLSLLVEATNLRAGSSGGELPELNARAEASLKSGQLTVAADATEERHHSHAHVDFSCPLTIGLIPPTWHVSPSAPMSGRLAATTDLRHLPHFLNLDDQSMDGQAEIDLHLGGTADAPTVSGFIHVQNATYENHRTGSRLTRIQGTARALGSKIDFDLIGSDGHDGKVQAKGTADMTRQTYTADIALDSARILRLDSFQSTVNGTASIHGTTDRARLRGELTLDPSEFRLPRSMPDNLPRIEITQINTTTVQTPTPTAPKINTDLDIQLRIPGRFYVTGRGLDSEWSGDIRIQGSHAAPLITGSTTLVRGRFEFLDRVFDLTRGTLTLDGVNPPNPYLDVIGETHVLDTIAQVHLLGPAKNFRLTLSSVPALPADEILALILFGRSMRQVSPLQAVRLAQAAAELTGIGATPDFFSSIKRKLGLQEVSVDNDANDDTSIGIGGYLGGQYYVRTQRSVSGQDRTKVEIQLTPSISAETEIGADSRQGGGISWKHDY